jgi:hypothetical protein
MKREAGLFHSMNRFDEIASGTSSQFVGKNKSSNLKLDTFLIKTNCIMTALDVVY